MVCQMTPKKTGGEVGVFLHFVHFLLTFFRTDDGRERDGRRGGRNWDRRYNRRDRLPATTKSGRIIKGRGVFVSPTLYFSSKIIYNCPTSDTELRQGADPGA